LGIQKIADMANVSIATVSRVINNPEVVKKRTREKIQKILEETSYEKYNNQFTPPIHKDIIGVIIPDVINSFFARVLEGVIKQAKKLDLPVTLYLTHDDPSEELNAIDKLIEQQVKGLVFIRSRNKEKESMKSIQKLNKNSLPFVLVDRDMSYSDNSGVFLSNASAVYDAINLLANDGYKRIAIITGPKNNMNAIQRLDGYKQALFKNGLSFDESLIYRGNFSIESGLEETIDILEQKEIPDAIFSCANQITIGCLKAINEKKLKVGKDIKLFSFNKPSASQVDNFDFSYVEHPVSYMGERSVIILNNKLVGTKGLIREIMDYKINY